MSYERTKIDYRRIYIDNYGEIPKGFHIHHIDGDCHNNDPSNLEALSPEDHYWKHIERGELGAAALLSDGIDSCEHMKGVVMFDLSGNKVREFESISEAAEYFPNGNTGGIKMCCSYDKKSLYDSQFMYKSEVGDCLLYTSPSPRDATLSRMPSSA